MPSGIAWGIVIAALTIFAALLFVGGKKIAPKNFDIPGTPLTRGTKNQAACPQGPKQCPNGTYVWAGPDCTFAECPRMVGKEDRIVVTLPKANSLITSPVVFSGKARGIWFFEGSFPVEVYNENDVLLGSASAEFIPTEEGETWMTEDFINFQGTATFTNPLTETGYLLFKKDNPSDQRELDDSFVLPVRFQ